MRERLPSTRPVCLARPAFKSMFRPSIPMLYPCHTELGVPFSQLERDNSFMHDGKTWW